MINYDLVLFGIFIIALLIFYKKCRKKIEFQGIIALYRTKLGTVFSEKIVAKSPKFFKAFGYFSVVIGFIGMGVIFYTLIRGAMDVFLNPAAAPVVAPVLPFVKIPGLPPLLFTYWIIGIFVVAVIHEFSHALLSVAHGIKVKSSGFAFFGPIPAAFVEPDEKKLVKKSRLAQLSVFAAGPGSNLVTGLIFFLIFAFVISPPIVGISDVTLSIAQVIPDSPAEMAQIPQGATILELNNLIATSQNLSSVFSELKPGDEVILKTEQKEYVFNAATNAEDETKGFIGISIESNLEVKEGESKVWFDVLMWIQRLFFWLFALSIGIGLFNLLPLGPIDGGRMLLTVLPLFSKNEKLVKRIFSVVSFISLAAIILSLTPWLTKAFSFLGRIGN